MRKGGPRGPGQLPPMQIATLLSPFEWIECADAPSAAAFRSSQSRRLPSANRDYPRAVGRAESEPFPWPAQLDPEQHFSLPDSRINPNEQRVPIQREEGGRNRSRVSEGLQPFAAPKQESQRNRPSELAA